jgi:glycine/D-amino acid oxidase-like deaminating enzyme/nitrite reductase/ring-hydroxylating ferredoxin subunit
MAAPKLNRPLWLEPAEPRYPALSSSLDVDVAVIGAGITGVTTAYLLKQAGKSVALLESSAVGHGATGYTTAKLTVGHSLVYHRVTESFGEDAARAYARSNQEAIERIAAIVRDNSIDCDLERPSNYVYTERESSVADVEREASAARAAGVEAQLTRETDLPYPVRAAIRVDDQAQFHPWKYLDGLAGTVDGDGSHVLELTRATDVRRRDTCEVETTTGVVRAAHVVVATQMPFLDRGLYFTRAHPMKSYAIAARVADDGAPRGMYISVDRPTRSIRSTPAEGGGRMLIVGGEGHKPGDDPNTKARYAKLEAFMQERFGVSDAEYRWSTHDYMPVDRLPYIGRLRRGDDRVYVATGFAKWGLTKATIAAGVISDAILGRANEWAELYDSTRFDARHSAARFAKENAAVGLHFFRDRLQLPAGRDDVERLAPGEGTIARVGAKQYAVHRDDVGELHVLSARCTHLGCIVGWNNADRSWECPCHGSRFAADGSLVQGPATADLPRDSLPE